MLGKPLRSVTRRSCNVVCICTKTLREERLAADDGKGGGKVEDGSERRAQLASTLKGVVELGLVHSLPGPWYRTPQSIRGTWGLAGTHSHVQPRV